MAGCENHGCLGHWHNTAITLLASQNGTASLGTPIGFLGTWNRRVRVQRWHFARLQVAVDDSPVMKVSQCADCA